VERALILSQGAPLTFDDLSGRTEEGRPSVPEASANKTLNLDAVTSNHIRRILEMTNGRVHGKGGAAELLGINPSTLRYRMNQLRIPYGRKSRR
jgi:DNA-binding NtrC family response regulator